MMQKASAVKRRLALRKLAKLFGAAAGLVLLCTVLFFVNRFHLVVLPLEGNDVSLEPGSSFSDPGAQTRLAGSIFFQKGIPVNGDITSKSNVDINTPGTYSVVYSARFLNWQGEGQRTVTVRDSQPPRITLHSTPGNYTIPGELYQEEGYSAFDDMDGDLTDKVIREEKDGFVTYSVTDAAGNHAAIRRKIYYYDSVPPVITLNGGETVSIEAAAGYAEPGFTAADNVDGDITDRVTIQGTVDPYIAGTYTLTYSAADSTGNVTSVVRTVIVNTKERAEIIEPQEKTIYLTFDDGPGKYTEQLLDILAEYDVKATFFVVNTEYIDLIQRIVSEGHAIGIHSVTHDYNQIYASPDAFFSDLRGMQNAIYEKTGIMTYLMRFPGGSSNTVSKFNPGIMTYLTQAVEDAGFYYFDWNVDSKDAGGAKTAKRVCKNIKAGVQEQNASIVLQHDIKEFSVEAVEDIIQWGLENGYTFRCLDETSPNAHHGVNN